MLLLSVENFFKLLEPKLRYVVDIFNSIYVLEQEIEIVYGKEKNNSIHVLESGSMEFFQSNLEKPEIIDYINWIDRKIPILFSTCNSDDVIVSNESTQSITIQADVLSSSFYFLSCWQEFRSSVSDEMGRFPAKASLLFDLDVLQIPIVNYYFDIIATAVGSLRGEKPSIRNFDHDSFHVCISHDIDRCYTGWKEDSLRQFVGGDYWPALQKVFQRIWKPDVWFNFDQMLRMEEELNIKASYFFLAQKKRVGKYKNADYNLSSTHMQSILKSLVLADHEVGIHGSIGSAFDSSLLRKEIQHFSGDISGIRFHNLMFRIPESFNIIEETGLAYDSSLGFAEKIGFRNGFCFPYQPYNFLEERTHNFIEFPLMLMDVTLIQSNYMSLSPSESLELATELISEIKKFHGFFVLLWHNNTLTGFKYGEWEGVFRRIVQTCLEQKATIKPFKSYIQNSLPVYNE